MHRIKQIRSTVVHGQAQVAFWVVVQNRGEKAPTGKISDFNVVRILE